MAEQYTLRRIRGRASERGINLDDVTDDMIRTAMQNIQDEINARAPENNANELAPLQRNDGAHGDDVMMTRIIGEIQWLRNGGGVRGPNGEIPNPAAAAALPPPDAESVSPPPPPHPPRGGSRKVKKTKSSNKRPTARRRHRSSNARNARKSSKVRKARSTRRR